MSTSEEKMSFWHCSMITNGQELSAAGKESILHVLQDCQIIIYCSQWSSTHPYDYKF